MPEVDPVTGYPKEETDSGTKHIDKYNRLNEQKAKADQLQESINSDAGQLVINKVKEHLLARVSELIDADPQCKALKRLLVDMGITLNIGEKAVEGLMRLVAKRQTP